MSRARLAILAAFAVLLGASSLTPAPAAAETNQGIRTVCPEGTFRDFF